MNENMLLLVMRVSDGLLLEAKQVYSGISWDYVSMQSTVLDLRNSIISLYYNPNNCYLVAYNPGAVYGAMKYTKTLS
jgi:hypothetical protein